jgi:hypothetical protein
MDQQIPKESQKIAGRVYDPSDYQKNDELSSGLAETHEQFSDVYMEGEISAVIEQADGKNDIPMTKTRNMKE